MASAAPFLIQRKEIVPIAPSSTSISRFWVAKNTPPSPMFSIVPSTASAPCVSRAGRRTLRRLWVRRFAASTSLIDELLGRGSRPCPSVYRPIRWTYMNCVRRATAREPGRRDPPSILALTFMNDDTTCRQLRDHLDQAEPGSIPGTMTAHAASCPPCGRLLRRQARLVRMLESLPAAPSADVARPALPD